MSKQPDDVDDAWDDRAEAERIRSMSDLDESLAAYEKYFAHMLVLRFGKEILSLSVDDQGLLVSMKSGDTERQRMALASMLELRYLYHTEIIDICADYLERGSDVDIRLDCVSYLYLASTGKYDDRAINILQNCLQRLMSSRSTKDDDAVIALINYSLLRMT